LAYLLAQRGTQLDEALSLAQRAVRAYLNSPYFLSTLGWVHCQRGELAEAESAMKKAIELYGQTPDAAESWEHLGRVYEKKEDVQAAKEAYQRARELQPDDEAT
jgi:Flp pilus assembly protein TadD